MCLYYYPRCGVYLYASTEAILNRALGRLNLPIGKPERIMLDCGDILKLTHSGRREMSSFDASSLMDPWGSFSMWPTPTRSRTRQTFRGAGISGGAEKCCRLLRLFSGLC